MWSRLGAKHDDQRSAPLELGPSAVVEFLIAPGHRIDVCLKGEELEVRTPDGVLVVRPVVGNVILVKRER